MSPYRPFWVPPSWDRPITPTWSQFVRDNPLVVVFTRPPHRPGRTFSRYRHRRSFSRGHPVDSDTILDYIGSSLRTTPVTYLPVCLVSTEVRTLSVWTREVQIVYCFGFGGFLYNLCNTLTTDSGTKERRQGRRFRGPEVQLSQRQNRRIEKSRGTVEFTGTLSTPTDVDPRASIYHSHPMRGI